MTLAAWAAMFEAKFAQYLDELGDMGEQTASSIFAMAPAEYGNSDVAVSRSQDGCGFQITASGHDAVFLEFGTGVDVAITRPTVQPGVPIGTGTWSREVEGEFYKTGYRFWHYGGVKMSGTPPLGAMQEACSAIEQWSSTIARRVFG